MQCTAGLRDHAGPLGRQPRSRAAFWSTIRHRDPPAYLLAVALASVALLLAMGVFAFGSLLAEPFDPRNARHMFDAPGEVNLLWMGWRNNWPQLWAHRSVLLAVALACVLLGALGPRRTDTLARAAARRAAPVAIGIALGVTALLEILDLPTGSEYLAVGRQAGPELALGLLGSAVLFAFGRRLLSDAWSRVCLALALVLLGGLLLPALFQQPDFSHLRWSVIEEWEAHYEIVMGAADGVAQGRPLGEFLVPYYGLVGPVLLGSLQRRLGPWTFGDYVLLVQLAQLVFFLLLLPAYARFTRGRWLLGLLALIFVSLDFHFATYLRIYPNLMGWRFLGFPLAFLGLLGAQGLSARRAALLLGVVSGFCLLYNFETGIAVAAGLAACLGLRTLGEGCRPRQWAGRGLIHLGGITLALAGFLLLHRVGLGRWMEAEAVLAIGRHLLSRGGGFGSDVPSFDPMAVLMLGHSAAVLLQAWMARREPLSQRGALRVLAATILLVWFAYYAHRPNFGSLSSLLVPYSFLLLDSLRCVSLGGHRGVGRWKLGLSLATLAFVVIPHVVFTARAQAPAYLQGFERLRAGPPPGARLVQGIHLPDDARTRRILAQSEFLRARPEDQPLVYFASDNYLVAKLSRWPRLPLPIPSPFWGTLNAGQYREMLRFLDAPEVQRIYFDSWRGFSRSESDSTPGLQVFFRDLRSRISRRFEHERSVSGWEEWVKRPTAR